MILGWEPIINGSAPFARSSLMMSVCFCPLVVTMWAALWSGVHPKEVGALTLPPCSMIHLTASSCNVVIALCSTVKPSSSRSSTEAPISKLSQHMNISSFSSTAQRWEERGFFIYLGTILDQLTAQFTISSLRCGRKRALSIIITYVGIYMFAAVVKSYRQPVFSCRPWTGKDANTVSKYNGQSFLFNDVV